MPPLYILRHGETVWNRAGRLQGALDSGLTALGRVQAARQGVILRAACVSARVWCSPLGRARATAALAGLSVTTDARLREISMGDWDGELISAIAPPAGVVWKFDGPGGESRADAQARIEAFLSALSGPTIIVTHGVVATMMRARLLGLSDTEWNRLDDPQGVVHLIKNGIETLMR